MTKGIISSLSYACSQMIMSYIGTFFLCKVIFCSLALWEVDCQRKFNVAKCHFMRVSALFTQQILYDYTLHQQTLENVQSAKYHGITITQNMDISDISFKATKTRFS